MRRGFTFHFEILPTFETPKTVSYRSWFGAKRVLKYAWNEKYKYLPTGTY